jgi:hypothetical protein
MLGSQVRAGGPDDRTPKRRRNGRGLGPFSSGHLTIIIVVVVVAVAFPFAAFAATGNNVFVADATTGAQAKVNGFGQLSTVATVTGTAAATSPNNMFTVLVTTAFPDCGIVPQRTGWAVVVTNATISVSGITAHPGSDADVLLSADTKSGCGGPLTTFAHDVLSTDTPYNHSFGAGVSIKNGHFLDVSSFGNGSATAEVSVSGYYVPSAACTTGCL